jgi:ATP-dependent Zn protease
LLTNRINTLLDASFVVPAKIGQLSLRLPPARPRKEDVFFVGACNVARGDLDPALTRPGRMGYTVYFHSPDIAARADILDLYVNRIAHEPELASKKRLNELARITMGYSPAMIEQAMSLALANAHFDNRTSASWQDTVRALTVVGYGDARDLTYTDDERRAIAIHEAGHAVTGHVYKDDWQSSRLSIVPRGGSHGHHAMAQAEPRHLGFSKHHFAELIWGLGAIAAEYVFYNDTSVGVGGDLDHVTAEAASMVGQSGMRATMPDLSKYVADQASIPAREKALRERFARIGQRLMNRSYTASILGGPSLAAILDDDFKREEAAVLIGHAFMTAYWLIVNNQEATRTVAEAVLEKKELYGDQVVDLLNSLSITIPDIDPTDESNWPRI